MNRKLRIILDNLGGDFKHVKENRYIHVYVSSMAYMIWKQGNHGNEGNKSEHFLRTSHSEEVVKLKTWQGVMIVLLLVSHRVMLSASQSPLVCLTFSYFSPHDLHSCVWPCSAFLLTISTHVFSLHNIHYGVRSLKSVSRRILIYRNITFNIINFNVIFWYLI